MEDLPATKRPRLSMACNECRRRKVKCDTEYPKCRNCRLRNDVCTTTDPKRPHVVISREWIDPPMPSQPVPPFSLKRGAERLSESSSQPQSSRTRPNASLSPGSNAVPGASVGSTGISPAQQPYEMVFNTEPSSERIKMMGGSSSQCLMKSLDVYLKSARSQPLSGNFRHGMRHAEEMDVQLCGSLPALPEVERCSSYVSSFFDKIHPTYPLFDIDNTKNRIRQLASETHFDGFPHDQLPRLASAYLIVSIGADEQTQTMTEDGTKYLHAAASLLGHIILTPYLPTVQALLLFTLAYRGRNKDGIGWQTLGMAIRVAYTLGLHRFSTKNPPAQHGIQDRYQRLFHARIWAICCSLEKVMQLESGRPAMIHDVDIDHMMSPEQRPPGQDFLKWLMELAKIQGLISQHIYGHQPGVRTAESILSDTAKLDQSLLSWATEIPTEFRPGSDLFCSSQDFHVAAYLSVQYYQAVIALHRAALIAPASTFLSEVANHCPDSSTRLRIQAGEQICVNSARSIAKLAVELSDRNIQSRILTAGPFLLACIVLGISLMKNPKSRIMGADLELLKFCAEYTVEQYRHSGQNVQFNKGVTSIYEEIRSSLEGRSTESVTPSKPTNSTLEGGLGTATPMEQNRHTRDLYLPAQQSETTDNNNTRNGNSKSTATNGAYVPSDLGTSSHHNDPIYHGIADTEGNDVMPLPMDQDLFPDGLPFDNFNVQDLWNWMGDTEGYDNYSYNGSYNSNDPS